jgi:tetratricopeptide (TPR) repeat protein
VIHRDVKPANLLLDPSGRLWVTDFGLALLHNNPALTVTGELVGTLRYMSPEQSLGRRGTVDHRTDVYSLGVTLYELLTLEPAFDGQDTRELLNQLATSEPRPPRRTQRAIPLDLETVVLKAIAKNPAERYASAQELAEDLRRFLDDEPVQARRPTLLERVGKWGRRHKPLVGSAISLLVLAVLVLGIGIIWMTRERAATKMALQCARRQASAAREQHARAEESFRQARNVVDYFTRVSAEELAGMPPLVQGVRRRMLETALLYYQNFLDQRRDDPSLQAELEGCRAHASKILEELYALEATGKVLLAAEPAVQADLQITENQREHLRQLADHAAQQAHDALVGCVSPEEAAENRGEPLADILTPEQARRLDQITLQKRMVYGACDPHVVEELHLTPEQQAAIRSIQQEVRLSLWASIHHDGLPGARREAPHEFWKTTSEKVLEVLNDDQKTAWKQMTGEPFKGRARSTND